MKLTKKDCMSAFINLARSTGTKKCEKNITCDECENQCKTRKQYDKDCLLIEKLINEYFDLVEENRKLQRFKDCFDDLYNTGLEVTSYHLNGKLEPFDNFYDGAIEWSERNEND